MNIKNKSIQKILHSILFNAIWGLILYIELQNPEQKTFFLSAAALSFIGLHFAFFTKNFMKELVFLVLGFAIGFGFESSLSNSGIYQYGLVDLPQFGWPPPWMTALWLMFPPFFNFTLSFLKDYKIMGSFAVAASTLGTYYLVGSRFDLIFFGTPILQTFTVFVLAWYLMLRVLVWLKCKLAL